MSKATKERKQVENGKPAALLRLDLGCGPNPREGFEGVDRLPFDGKVKHVVDLAQRRLWKYPDEVSKVPLVKTGETGSRLPFKEWPWPDASVEEVHSSHFVEHLTAPERVHFFNELHRILVPGGKATIICPNWSSARAYGDPTHQWPPMGVFFFWYLTQAWRDQNAPHTDRTHWPEGYSCDFDWMCVYGINPELTVRSEDYQRFALANYIEAGLDLHATLTKRKEG